MAVDRDPVVILSYARTPMGSFQGALAGATATQLGADAVRGAVGRSGVSAADIERIYMGCVLPAGLGQAPARQAAIGAGLGDHVEATTVNKMCGSGMQAAILAADALAAGSVELLVAGGMESMTNAPYLSKSHRGGARIGHDRMYDHMYLDGLEDAVMADARAAAMLGHQIGRVGHALHAARDDDVGRPRRDGVGGHHHRLHS